jgi:hypothetical protein
METTIEKTAATKVALKILKYELKELAAKQKYLKKIRKDATFSYDQSNGRIIWDPMSPSQAQSEVYWNGKRLRLKYAAYGLLRGKKFSQIENHYPEETHPLNNFKAEIDWQIDTLLKSSAVQNAIKE